MVGRSRSRSVGAPCGRYTCVRALAGNISLEGPWEGKDPDLQNRRERRDVPIGSILVPG